jgi:AraC-like DNA-binding protein
MSLSLSGGVEVNALEKHYTVEQVAEAWGVSTKTIRRHFQDMPGVLKLRAPSLLARRRRAPRTTLRIPESLLRRAHEDGTRGFGRKV